MTLSKHTNWILVVATLAIVAWLAFADPFGPTASTIAGLAVTIALAAWGVRACVRSGDEVARAANAAGMTWGALAGIGLSVAVVMTVRHVQPATDLVTNLAGLATNDIGPAAVGFALGVSFTCVMVSLCALAAMGLWWMGKR